MGELPPQPQEPQDNGVEQQSPLVNAPNDERFAPPEQPGANQQEGVYSRPLDNRSPHFE